MHNIETEIIAASVRNPIHVIDCAKAGADIATVPYKVLEQMTKHPLTTRESPNSRQITVLCLGNDGIISAFSFSPEAVCFSKKRTDSQPVIIPRSAPPRTSVG